MIIEGHKLLDMYRRLRILYNRVGIFGDKTWYSDWFKYTFQTKLGPRTFVCTILNREKEDEYLQFWYYQDEQKSPLFVIDISKKIYDFKNGGMSEKQAWLAIHELEELSYKELEKYNEI